MSVQKQRQSVAHKNTKILHKTVHSSHILATKTEIRSATTCRDLPKAAFKPVIPPLRQAVPFYVLPFGPPSLRDASLALRLLRVTPPSEAATLRDSTFGDGQAIDMLNQGRPRRAPHSELPASQCAGMTRKRSLAQRAIGGA